MKVGIDSSVCNINQAGSSVYAGNLLTALRELQNGFQCRTFAVSQQRNMGDHKTWHSRIDTLYRDLVWTHGVLPYQVHRKSVDVLHMPAGVIPIYSPCPTVVTIFDTTILQKPQDFTFWHRYYSRVFMPLSARRASKVITISRHSKRDIVRQTGIASDKVAVTYLAASPVFRCLDEQEIHTVAQKYGPEPFVLTVGTLEPRKNIKRLLAALKLLDRQGIAYPLVHVGPPGWIFKDIFAEVERLGLQDRVYFLGHIPLEDLVGLYNAALLFVYPSLYEGFGLPVLEAMACGCPVVTSNTSSLPEVVETAGVMIDPCDAQAIADGMKQVLINPMLAHDLHERGLAQAHKFSWSRCARETLEVYYQVFAEH